MKTIKCKNCGEIPDGSSRRGPGQSTVKWYFRKSFIIFALCSVGPLALPLIWWRPETTRGWKIGLTIVVLGLSWILFQLTMESIQKITEYYKLLDGL